MDEPLRRWVETTAGGTVASASRGFTGGSRQLWYVDVDVDTGAAGGRRALVLRVERGGGAFSGTELSLAREATVYRALQGTGVPVAGLVGCSPTGDALLLERVPGSSDLRDLGGDEGYAVVESFMGALGRLHGLDPGRLDLPGFARPATAEAHATADLALWARLVDDHLARPEPMVAYALAWLAAHPPPSVQRTVLVHGDAGPGNFVADGGRVTALVDWEMSHVGDPMDDVAWLDLRSAAAGPFADVVVRDRLYEDATGLTVDVDAVRYYAAFVRLRCAVTTSIAIARGGGAVGLAAYHPPHHRFLVELGEALADAIDADAEPAGSDDVAEVGEAGDTSLHDHVLEGLRAHVVPHLDDPVDRLHARAAVILLEHLRAREQVGAALEEAERQDRLATFRRAVPDAELVGLAERAGTTGDATVLGQLLRGARRRLRCWAVPSAAGGAGVRRSPRRVR